MTSEKTLDDFQINTYAYPIIEGKGVKNKYTDGWLINTSEILTKLIQEAGRFCERHASDLFIDWSSIDKMLENGENLNKTILFGFHKNGVHTNNSVVAGIAHYGAIYRLDIVTKGNDITMQLGRVE